MTVEDKIACQADNVHAFVEKLVDLLAITKRIGLEVNTVMHNKIYNTLRDNIWQIEDTVEDHVKTR